MWKRLIWSHLSALYISERFGATRLIFENHLSYKRHESLARRSWRIRTYKRKCKTQICNNIYSLSTAVQANLSPSSGPWRDAEAAAYHHRRITMNNCSWFQPGEPDVTQMLRPASGSWMDIIACVGIIAATSPIWPVTCRDDIMGVGTRMDLIREHATSGKACFCWY